MLQQNGQKSSGQGGGRVTLDEDGDDQEDPSSSQQVSDGELANFRAQWCKELESSQTFPSTTTTATTTSPEIGEDCDEEKARLLFLKGVENEQKGKLYEAIQFYRRAVQLVPDIEFRLYESTNQRTLSEAIEGAEEGDPADIEDNLELEDDSEEEDFDPSQIDLFSHLQRILNKTYCVCQPKVPQKTTHISSLPVEIILYILRWVVSSDLDMRSLEMSSMISRGFYVCSRDPEIWRLACIRVWGVNCGLLSKYNSWREMFISRPRIHFHGCYISKTTYVRHGENSFQDQFYRPWHFVEYFRYLRFFPEGLVLMLTSSEEPLSCLGLLKTRQVRNPSVLVGHYRLSSDRVTLTVQKQESLSLQKFRSRKNNNTPEQTFHLEFDIVTKQSNNRGQLRWKYYSVFTKYWNGQETRSAFEVIGPKFPPLWFSRVKSYTAESDCPLM